MGPSASRHDPGCRPCRESLSGVPRTRQCGESVSPNPCHTENDRFVTLPPQLGVDQALSYPGMETIEGHAMIGCLILSRSSCRNWSFPEVGAPARSAALVPGIDCGADLVGQTCSSSPMEHYCMTSESQTHSAPLPATPLTTLQHASQGPMQPTCSGQIGPKTVN